MSGLGHWVLVNQRVTFHEEGQLTMTKGRRPNHQINAVLKVNHTKRTRQAGEALVWYLTSGNVKEDWQALDARLVLHSKRQGSHFMLRFFGEADSGARRTL